MKNICFVAYQLIQLALIFNYNNELGCKEKVLKGTDAFPNFNGKPVVKLMNLFREQTRLEVTALFVN